ncbi:hypothetical protein GUJ93_ZPchr0013g36270 [Zizania palustris]|uniref:Uncharacterized protein n=1 Tax=Zizania palustris TaxID=103762 RepID=A0A8J5WXI2_ZIZPA|nr:hypothetical protein GUJ93_ZPchr0013g36270 [Zizania palustris]
MSGISRADVHRTVPCHSQKPVNIGTSAETACRFCRASRGLNRGRSSERLIRQVLAPSTGAGRRHQLRRTGGVCSSDQLRYDSKSSEDGGRDGVHQSLELGQPFGERTPLLIGKAP